jgi:hypothetical protein
VDPETPIIPYTKETLAIRRQRDEEERQNVLSRAKRHARPLQSSPSASSADHTASVSTSPQPEQAKVARQPPATDDFLKQIRDAREAMKEQEEWFKQQTVTLEKEIVQEEEFRRSQESRPSSATSTYGPGKAHGYDYVPAETKSDFGLSRTERRIRQTGAHGLATKPVRPRPSSEYVAVAMSKKSALLYQDLKWLEGRKDESPQKRSYDNVDPALDDDGRHGLQHAAPGASKRPRSVSVRSGSILSGVTRPAKSTPTRGPNPSELLPDEPDHGGPEGARRLYEEGNSHQDREYHGRARNGDDDEEDLEAEEDESGSEEEGDSEELLEDDDDQPETVESGGRSTSVDRDDPERSPEEDNSDDDDDDSSGGEIADVDAVAGERHTYHNEYPPVEDAEDTDDTDDGTGPSTDAHRRRAASSAAGTSLDDALVLSDSD